jgi:hypothetical protein
VRYHCGATRARSRRTRAGSRSLASSRLPVTRSPSLNRRAPTSRDDRARASPPARPRRRCGAPQRRYGDRRTRRHRRWCDSLDRG